MQQPGQGGRSLRCWGDDGPHDGTFWRRKLPDLPVNSIQGKKKRDQARQAFHLRWPTKCLRACLSAWGQEAGAEVPGQWGGQGFCLGHITFEAWGGFWCLTSKPTDSLCQNHPCGTTAGNWWDGGYMGFKLMCVRLWFWLGQEVAEHSCGRTQNEGDSGRSALACPSSCYHCFGTNRARSTPAFTPHTCGHAEFRCSWPNSRAAESPVPMGSQAKQVWATWPHQSLLTTLLADYLEILLVQAKRDGVEEGLLLMLLLSGAGKVSSDLNGNLVEWRVMDIIFWSLSSDIACPTSPKVTWAPWAGLPPDALQSRVADFHQREMSSQAK